MKGMPEALLHECEFYLDKDGISKRLEKEDRDRFQKTAHVMGSKGLRPVLITFLQFIDQQLD